MSRIAVLGSANMDLVVRQSRLPHPGETMFGTDFSTVPGGKGLNQAVAAARAGGEVEFLGAVGTDAFGSELRDCLRREGIGVDGLATVAEPTGTAHIAVLDGGENTIVVVSGANIAQESLDQSTRDRIAASDYLVVQFERPAALVAEALTLASGLGITTILTPAPVRPVDPGLFSLVDILIPNEQEARELAGVDDELDAARELSRQAGIVVVTRGVRGAVVARDGELITDVPPHPVEAVDTTAAGDTFVGVLVARLASGDELDAALEAASVAAAISVTRSGASTSMPTWDEISSALRA
jgi:ribokinase